MNNLLYLIQCRLGNFTLKLLHKGKDFTHKLDHVCPWCTVDELKRDIKQMKCSHAFDMLGTCRLCNLKYTDRDKLK